MRAALVALLVATVGCGGEPGGTPAPESGGAAPAAGDGEVVARYAGKTLTTDQVMKELERLPAPSRTYLNAPERKRQFVENMIVNDLLFEEGRRAGFDKDAEIERQVNDLRRRLVVQRVMRQYQTPPEITDEQTKQYYDENPTLYSTTQIRASHILVKDEALAREILAEVRRNPERFAELAKEKSTDTTSAQKGGDLGMFGQGRMVPDFERVAFALKPGEVSDVVRTQYGWHIIRVTERKEGERKPYEQVKEQIRATLRNKALQDRTQGHLEELKRQANVRIDEAVLAKVTPPPPAAGAPATSGHGGH